MIIAAKTGPPALPVKPKLNSHRYEHQQQLPPFRQCPIQQQQQQQQLDHENLKNSIRRHDSGSNIATLSLQVTGGSKRQKVIQELMKTEKTFQKIWYC
jgi:hypothetical protein